MKIAKSALLMAMGGAAVLMYQKYNKPVMEAMDKAVKNVMNKADEKLEDMM